MGKYIFGIGVCALVLGGGVFLFPETGMIASLFYFFGGMFYTFIMSFPDTPKQ